MAKIVGHTFLAKLGKKRLRPGGIKATNWLLGQTNLNNKEILEVACNMGTTSFMLAKKYQSNITAIDKDTVALDKAKQRLDKTNLASKLKFLVDDALNLSFDNNSFDVVLNEAMLTMLNDKNKQTAIGQYFRVLADIGVLLTHDICFLTDDITIQKQIIADMSRAINIEVAPKSISQWQKLFSEAGFSKVVVKTGKMSLLNPVGMIRDEGLFNMIKIIKNAHRKENIDQFRQMRQVFKKYNKQLGFIAVCSYK